MTESAAPTLTEVTNLTRPARANPQYPPDSNAAAKDVCDAALANPGMPRLFLSAWR
jgi:hypothetical protein